MIYAQYEMLVFPLRPPSFFEPLTVSVPSCR